MSAFEIFWLIVTGTILTPILLYYAARLIFSAYFITKLYYEKRKFNGTR